MKIPKNLEEQYKQLKEKFPKAKFLNGDGLGIIHIPDFKIGCGWNKETTDIYFKIPTGFPMAYPTDFYTKLGLNRADGIIPKNTQHIFLNSIKRLMFYWRVRAWSPNYDTLLTYVRVIQSRLNQAV